MEFIVLLPNSLPNWHFHRNIGCRKQGQIHFTLHGDSTAHAHLPYTRGCRTSCLLQPSRQLCFALIFTYTCPHHYCNDFHQFLENTLSIHVRIITLIFVVSSWVTSSPSSLRRVVNFLSSLHQADENNAGSSWDQGSVSTGEDLRALCCTDVAVQGISVNGSKPGSGCTSKARVKGERESRVSQI